MGAILNNPIAWGHFKVRGGWKNHLWSTFGYLVLITGVIIVTTRLNPVGAMLLMWTNAMLGLQLAVLALYGCTVIGNSVRSDIASGLLESHRLMPISSGGAVLGYLMGPTLQAISLATINFLVGTTTATLSGISLDKWIMANVIVIFFVAFLWVGVAFASFVAKNAFGMIFGLMISAIMGSSGGLVELVPAMNVLITPLIGNSIFVSFLRGGPVPIGYAWAFLAQFIFGTIFYLGAMRRYRRDDISALGVTLGLLLLAAWVATSGVGVLRWADFHPTWGARRSVEAPDRGTAVISTLLLSMLIALAPISAAARTLTEWMRTFLASGQVPSRRPTSPLLVSALAAIIAMPIVCIARPHHIGWISQTVSVAVVLLCFFISASYLFRLRYRSGRKAPYITAVWIVLTWVIPVAIDTQLRKGVGINDRPLFSLLSPMGELMDLFSSRPTESIYGLVFQALFTVALAGVYLKNEPNARAPMPAMLLKSAA